MAVDVKKFRTCQDTGFCRRNSLDPASLEVAENGVIRGLVAGGTSGGAPPLQLEVALYESGVARVRITEAAAPNQKPRWEAEDVLMPLVPVAGERVEKGDPRRPAGAASADIVMAYGKGAVYALAISFNPLRFDAYVNGAPVAAANAAGLLHFEQRKRDGAQGERALPGDAGDAPPADADVPQAHSGKEVIDYGEDGKAVYADGTHESDSQHRQVCTEARKSHVSYAAMHAVLSPNVRLLSGRKFAQEAMTRPCPARVTPAEDPGLGEERFDGHVDTKPFGATSVGMDVWFPGSQELYGIPEHAASMALKAKPATAPVTATPTALYTLDVFEYELDVPMALYGAIPLASEPRRGRHAAAFWWNPTRHSWTSVLRSQKRASHGAGGTAVAFWWNLSETFVDVSFAQQTDELGEGVLHKYVDEECDAFAQPMFKEHRLPLA
ncbi:hypothetical protein JKP88DRAFT_273278 [Tribonema minus]|uniref:Glycoside hydrolase family 31 N-terminal domain-containing protein n=1 Tax=Tribonema minus TaxID=303371 RepID=A0A835YV05_9STRA|nr:hypothetical protein JKP88DRAFT_273278 [Tribonema minus]